MNNLETCNKLLHLVYDLVKKPTFEPKFTHVGAYQTVCFAFTLCIQAAFSTWKICSRGSVCMNKQT